MTWWLWHFEKRLIDMLLRSPSFHKGVQKVHKTVHQIQHGKPPEYYGGTHIDSEHEAKQGLGHFFKLFWDELKSGHKPQPPTKK
ncbi:hypothetical protein HRR76_000248 [Exophiala dermatitidis]|nr:hypothetical protein HRR74_004430 [Exophiala dermatitidis]KAJ4521033.1 hypothetical protein HRR73_003374 [Exophiala dermatitidis]KAJ4547616.1 hypothetical protein HRR76_000248 [Exophiala dermatitidis]KAJ4681732.1 hypothetical protein HRR92_002449 [Exophiala dermatitidis]KAJ4682215.1 hypothetical protein HRR93_001630 [Exophiala dermatitidis]